MIRNYLIIALRNLWRNKLVTIINLVGMAIAFGIFLSLWSWVRFETSFDRFHTDIESIYTLKVRFSMNGSEYTADRSAGAFGYVLEENFAAIDQSCRVSQPLEFEFGIPSDTTGVESTMRYYDERQVLAVDSSFLHFFTFPLIEGNKDVIFSARDHIVITESLANKLFGDEEAMNRAVKIGEGGYYTIVGVVADPPDESSIQFKALLGFSVMEEMGYPLDGYEGTMYYNYFKLRSVDGLAELDRSINELVKANVDSDLDTYFFLDSFKRLHLYGESKFIISVLMNLIMSIVILSIGSINFINLTTAFSSKRVKEITIRKSAGASKRQLIIQFMSETYLLLLVAMYLGFFIAEHLLPETSRAFGMELEPDFKGLKFWLQVLGVFVVTGLLAGLYPAVKIAGYKPLAFLSGKSLNNLRGGSRFRRILIVIQFTFSIIFILSSIFTIQQYDYLKEADLGFNREDVLYIRTKGRVWDDFPLIKQDLSTLHYVDGVSTGSEIPVKIDRGEIEWGERDGEHNKIARLLWTDSDFLNTFQIGLQEGDFFTKDRDTLNYEYVVVNRSLVDLMGWEDPVGREFLLWDREMTVLGVTDNINFFPFNLEVFGNEALIFIYSEIQDYIFVRLQPGTTADQIASIEEIFRKHNPGYEFEHDFISEYKYETLESSDGIEFIFKLFSAVAIFIAAMGLIGLSLFNSNRRTKEVGIRKAMGANTGVILNLLLSEFMKLVAISNLIAIPLAYLIMKRVFRIFSYSIDLKVSVFVVVVMFSVLLAIATVSFHAIRTARSNPADSLHYE